MKFYDREKELELLRNSEAQAEKAASFTVLMGRRRIGKTSLILKALEGKPFAYLFVSRDNEAMLWTRCKENSKTPWTSMSSGGFRGFANCLR